MAWTQDKINEAFSKVQKMSSIDEEFRTRVLQAPEKVIREIVGEEVPDNFKIKVIESDPAYSATFVLPAMVAEELNDGDLDAVAGGACMIDFGGCGANACAANAEAGVK